MPNVNLNTPSNSRFNSSLNEIDLCLREVFLTEMRLADPRDKTRLPSSVGTGDNWLWTRDNIFQVDDLTTEDIFDTYLLRNGTKKVDIQYPILAYKQNDLDNVFWGVGNRRHQWQIETFPENSEPEVNDLVYISQRNYPKYFGTRALIASIESSGYYLKFESDGKLIRDIKNKPILFYKTDFRQTGNKTPISFKAKAVTGTYSAAILVDNRDEAQYIRDHFILRCSDANIWFTYQSPVLNNVENQIFTVFNVPNLERYPASNEKLKGKGYIYGIGIDVNVWATVTDTPLTSEVIELIRLNLGIKGEKDTQRIIINN